MSPTVDDVQAQMLAESKKLFDDYLVAKETAFKEFAARMTENVAHPTFAGPNAYTIYATLLRHPSIIPEVWALIQEKIANVHVQNPVSGPGSP